MKKSRVAAIVLSIASSAMIMFGCSATDAITNAINPEEDDDEIEVVSSVDWDSDDEDPVVSTDVEDEEETEPEEEIEEDEEEPVEVVVNTEEEIEEEIEETEEEEEVTNEPPAIGEKTVETFYNGIYHGDYSSIRDSILKQYPDYSDFEMSIEGNKITYKYYFAKAGGQVNSSLFTDSIIKSMADSVRKECGLSDSTEITFRFVYVGPDGKAIFDETYTG